MKTAGIAVLALASWLASPAFAGDGDPAPAPNDSAKPAAAEGSKPKECGDAAGKERCASSNTGHTRVIEVQPFDSVST